MSGYDNEARTFPAEVVGPNNERRTVFVRKQWSRACGEWLIDASGNLYVKRSSGSGITPIPKPIEDEVAEAPAAEPPTIGSLGVAGRAVADDPPFRPET